MAWTEERVTLLKKLWGEGQSASQIAKELGGVTRNAVIGKVHRLGLSNRNGGAETPRPRDAGTTPKAARKTAAEKPAAAAAPPQAPVQARREIVPAGQPLPPQPSANEISPEVLATQREVQKNALRLSLMELTERTCKWPFGDPATDDFWFCGLPVEPGSPYCKPCAAVAYQPASTRRDRRR
ncbi:MAG: GcrA family cell cycle regulator [Pseudomonadota bacterium]